MLKFYNLSLLGLPISPIPQKQDISLAIGFLILRIMSNFPI